ncbi:lytic polysaccharide monooxygenase [Kitasatospora indigofera]|uniref:lytic polysaccharide monooxygenase n=1 Tax=Kitasatospora indigofera TaxID=67307 RepID=UPI0036A8BC24
MGSTSTETAAPRDLRATATFRTDGGEKLYGISLEWTTGANDGGGRPGDWDSGLAGGYPTRYEVDLNEGALRQSVVIGLHALPTWGTYWNLARTHWVSLGTEVDGQYRLRVRAKLADGWSPWTDTVTVDPQGAVAYVNPYSESGAPARAEEVTPAHGSVDEPVSRVLLTMQLKDPSPMCAAARERITADDGDWPAVVPPGTVQNPPWNGQYLEYRKFFAGLGPVVASANNPAYAGLDLTPAQAGGQDWPLTRIDAAATELTLRYGYTAFHRGWTWTHQWFVTVDGWHPDDGISWQTLEPFPFFVDLYGGPGEKAQPPYNETETHVIGTVPRKSGRHAFVNIWGGHGGHGGAGEFFVSVSDVLFD